MSAITERLSRVVVGDPIRFDNLTLFPLLADAPAEPGYRLLDEALADGSARVTEVSDAGHVPELRFVNDGDRPVLLLDGDELIGAKQNRILNLTVLAPAQKAVVIPVSCVEAGRWHPTSAEFASAQRMHFATGRARKAADVSDSLRRRRSRESNQGTVWRDIEERSRRMQVSSSTGAAAALYEGRHRPRLDAFKAAFANQPGQCGALFAINGRLVGLDLFDSPRTLAATLGKLVESHALDAIAAADEAPATLPEAPQTWLARIAEAEVERFAAVGEGEDWRLFAAGVAGGALVKDDHLIHLCAFRMADDEQREGRDDKGGGRLRLELDTDRRLIRWRGDSERYLHLRLHAPALQHERAPVDLALVLDRSGSMGGPKWLRAREAALASIDRLGPHDRVALVVFDDQIKTLLPLAPATAEARRSAEAALDGVGPRGTTNLGEGWLTGCGLIGRDGPDERLRRCFVLTDGQANVGIVDPAELAHHASELRRLGVVTDTFGIGDDYNEALLGQLADAGGGMFHDIAHAEGIPAAIGRELGDALEVIHADTRVQLTWDADLQVQALGTWRTDAARHRLTIQVGDLVSDQVLDLLVSVRFPPGDKDAVCPMRVAVSDGTTPLAEASMQWTWVDSARRKAQPRQRDVERRVGEHLAQQARRDATARNREGDLKRARDTLRAAVQRIRKYGKENADLLALADGLEADVEQHRQRLSSREAKETFAGTSAVMRGRERDGTRVRGGQRPARPRLAYLPAEDSPDLVEWCRRHSQIPREQVRAQAAATLQAIASGTYASVSGRSVDWSGAVAEAVAARRSIAPDAALPPATPDRFSETSVQVVNQTTLAAARRLTTACRQVLALNFANGLHPGGGFIHGNRSQESALCRSSALYATLKDDPMFSAHAARPLPDSTDWAILSPQVPVLRADDGSLLEEPWRLGILTCAAPYAPKVGLDAATRLMESRIRRVLAIARAYGYTGLVLGAWGCGVYGNDPARIAAIFQAALEEQAGVFQRVVFAIADWSEERQFLTPFAAALSVR